jgi:hypothetical protein
MCSGQYWWDRRDQLNLRRQQCCRRCFFAFVTPGVGENTSSSSTLSTASASSAASVPTILPNTGDRANDEPHGRISLLSILGLVLIVLVGMLSTALFTLFLHFRGVGRTARLIILIGLLLVVTTSIWFSACVLRSRPPASQDLKVAAGHRDPLADTEHPPVVAR